MNYIRINYLPTNDKRPTFYQHMILTMIFPTWQDAETWLISKTGNIKNVRIEIAFSENCITHSDIGTASTVELSPEWIKLGDVRDCRGVYLHTEYASKMYYAVAMKQFKDEQAKREKRSDSYYSNAWV